MSPAVSVIIVNLNRCDLLKACLRSVWAQTFRDFEVVVVDNGSADGSVAFLRSIDDPRLRVVELRENRGFAGGCNAGIATARGGYIATLNNDAEADPRWLEELLASMEMGVRVGMCASKILFHQDRERIDKAGHLIYLDGLNHGRGSGERDRGQYDAAADVLFPDAAAALYRREMLDEIGLFDESFFAYGDDADVGLRGRLAGWACRYVPSAVVYHIHSATTGEFSSLKAFFIERNRFLLSVKLFPLRLLVLTPFLTALRFGFHTYGALFMVGSSGQYAAGTSRRELVLTILRAYWSGLKHVPQMCRARRQVRRVPEVSNADFIALLWKHRISLRALTLAG